MLWIYRRRGYNGKWRVEKSQGAVKERLKSIKTLRFLLRKSEQKLLIKATAEESKSPIELFLQYFPSVEVQ